MLTIIHLCDIFIMGVDIVSLTNNNYKSRLIDKQIKKYLEVFGAVNIEGPKWCGKTWTSLNNSNSVIYMDEEENQERAELDVKSIFTHDRSKMPQLIDEWNLVPKIWDSTRRECDKTIEKGNYILTGSTTLPSKIKKKKIHHSGAGRIGTIKMYTMSLYESGDSTGQASIIDMYNGTQQSMPVDELELKTLANLIIRGGWPGNIDTKEDLITIIPKSYIDSILSKDMIDDEDKVRDKNKMLMLLKSLARNETSLASNSTIINDIEEISNNVDAISSKTTLSDYLDVLNRLYLIENQKAYSYNYRSPSRVGKMVKRHFTDPSLACSLLDLNTDKLISDLNTFGLMFESLVERDLRIYMEYLGGHLYHFRDNVTGLEVDSILEFAGGEYAAVEIKLGSNKIEEAMKNLNKFEKLMVKKPKFMCVIVGKGNAIMYNEQSNTYIVPIATLKP